MGAAGALAVDVILRRNQSVHEGLRQQAPSAQQHSVCEKSVRTADVLAAAAAAAAAVWA